MWSSIFKVPSQTSTGCENDNTSTPRSIASEPSESLKSQFESASSSSHSNLNNMFIPENSNCQRQRSASLSVDSEASTGYDGGDLSQEVKEITFDQSPDYDTSVEKSNKIRRICIESTESTASSSYTGSGLSSANLIPLQMSTLPSPTGSSASTAASESCDNVILSDRNLTNSEILEKQLIDKQLMPPPTFKPPYKPPNKIPLSCRNKESKNDESFVNHDVDDDDNSEIVQHMKKMRISE